MQSLIDYHPTNLIVAYGYPAIARVIALKSMGLPLPGETMLLTAAVYTGVAHQLGIVLVIVAASLGAVLGDNAGLWIGRRLGFRLLQRYGRYARLDERRLKLGRYLFSRHGKVVFSGHFIALLRAIAAPLVGANDMAWLRFLLFNMVGDVLWAALHNGGGYALGSVVQYVAGPVGIGLAVLTAVAMIAVAVFLQRHEAQRAAEAECIFPSLLISLTRTQAH